MKNGSLVLLYLLKTQILIMIWKSIFFLSNIIWSTQHQSFTDHTPVQTHSGHDCSARHLVAVIKRGDDGAEGAAEHPVPSTRPLVNQERHDRHVDQVGHSQIPHIHIWHCLLGRPAKKTRKNLLWSVVLWWDTAKETTNVWKFKWQVARSNKQGYITSSDWQLQCSWVMANS